MYTKTATVKNETGLHARPASEFIACAKQFKSKLLIKLLSSGEEVNAKSIVMLLSLGAGQGELVQISADGEYETQAVDTLVDLIHSGFGEL